LHFFQEVHCYTMGSASVALTTRRGKILFLRAQHPLLSATRDVVSVMKPYLAHGAHREVIDVQKIPFLLEKKRFFLFFSLWRFYENTQPFLFYGLKRATLTYPWPACILSQTGSVLFANTELAQMLGSLSSQIEGTSFLDLFDQPPSEKEDFRGKIYKLKTTQGYLVPVTISHMLSEGEYVAIFIFPADLKHIGHSMGDHFLINQFPLPAAFLDEHGGLRHVNNLLKEKIAVTCPRSLAQWISEKGRQSFVKNLKRLRKDPQLCGTQEIILEGTDGRPLSVVFKYLSERDPRAPGQFLVLFLMDDPSVIPAVKEADPHKLQMLGQLASGIVHDFNNLLTGILGFCDLLLQRHSSEDASFKDIEQIKQSAMRAARLIQQLLAFSKASVPSQIPISLTQCVQDLFPLMRRMVGPKILVSLEEKNSGKFIIYGDNGQLEQILLNLAINARDAMIDGGSLTFSLDDVTLRQSEKVVKGRLPPGRYVVLNVRDTGTGIEDHHIERIFDPFFSTKDQGQGTGLGLSNVLQMMEQFQGGISIQSELKVGTTFSLYFPEHKGQSVRRQTPMEASYPTDTTGKDPKNVKILLVEDEDPVRLFAARALRQKGYEVVEARDGGQALKILQNDTTIQVIVTDVMMPGIDGPSLAVMSHEINASIKILFVSGYPEEEVKSHLPTTVKEVYFLPKPFALADLVNKIQGFFE